MKSNFKKMDKLLLVLMLAFTIFGLVMIFSASSITAVLYNGTYESYYFNKQLIVVIVSWIIGFALVLKLKTKSYDFLAPVGMIGVLLSLILVMSYGTITNGSKSWFDLGFVSVQPSEFLKPIMIVYLAVYFDKLLKRKDYNIFLVFVPFIFIGICFGLIALQPDLGTALIVAGIAGIIFMYLPVNTKEMRKIKIGCAGVAVLGLILIFTYSLNGEQTSRLNFKAPCTRYTEKTGYQVCNGMIAISNGGLFGVGLGNSTQKYLYLPEAYTDFIFPIYIIAIKNDTACPITVAIAPPFTPILNPKINIGSNIIFITAPITNIIIEYLGDPSALIIFESAEYISINGAPSMIIFP